MESMMDLSAFKAIFPDASDDQLAKLAGVISAIRPARAPSLDKAESLSKASDLAGAFRQAAIYLKSEADRLGVPVGTVASLAIAVRDDAGAIAGGKVTVAGASHDPERFYVTRLGNLCEGESPEPEKRNHSKRNADYWQGGTLRKSQRD